MRQQPLADRMRPTSLDEIVGQKHLVGKNGVLRRMLEAGRITNMIFAGPPGTGKTTCAGVIAKQSDLPLYHLNATTASLSDIKEITASTQNMFGAGGVLLYLDEIQYFNRKQQQTLLEFMEDGRLVLIASTTENPYLYIYSAIISRSSVFTFKPVPPEEIVHALTRGMEVLNHETGSQVTAEDKALALIADRSGGDVRQALSILENAYFTADNGILTVVQAEELCPPLAGRFDRSGDVHYDLISCLQKSIRGSDVDAAMFYLAKILAGGDLLAACRRLQVIANEDIGLAYPLAAAVTRSCVESAKDLGLPEGAIPLAHAVALLATAPKSNAANAAYERAMQQVALGRGADLPEHLRGPSFRGYLYPHDYPRHYVRQQYLPDDLRDAHFFQFGESKTEQAAKSYYYMIRGQDPT